VTELPPELELVGRELTAAVARRVDRRRRRRRRRMLRVGAAAVGVFCAFAAAAFASGVGDDLHLDPTKWAIFERGSVDGGKAEFVKAHSKSGDGDSTFMVEHDAALSRYDAFLLHERVVTAAGRDGELGTLCTAAQLTRAESIALKVLNREFAPGARPDTTKRVVDDAVSAGFGGAACRGVEYAGERARFVYAGIEPRSMLMPGAR
jgi:hypothetical protein